MYRSLREAVTYLFEFVDGRVNEEGKSLSSTESIKATIRRIFQFPRSIPKSSVSSRSGEAGA